MHLIKRKEELNNKKTEVKTLRTMRYSVIIVTIATVLLLPHTASISPANSVNAESEIPLCVGDDTGSVYTIGDVIAENCTIYGNINCDTPYGFVIGKDGITINGSGCAITYVGNVSDSEGIHNEGYKNVTINNLTIINFCFGIYFQTADYGKITDNTIIYTMGSGIWLYDTAYSYVSGNKVGYGDEGHGVLISTSSHNNTIEHNTLTTGNGKGLCIEESNDNKLYYNFICGNRHGDILIEDGTGNVGDYNTATTVISSDENYKDQTDGNPCTYSCQSSQTDLTQINDDLITNGTIITSDYIFTKDIISPVGHGLIIGADGITIDGDNFVLDGVDSGSCDSCGIERSGIYNPGFDNVVIKNLEIKNFCNGIYLRGEKATGNYVYSNTIDNCEIHHNGNTNAGDTSTHGINMEYVFASTITNCSIHHNLGKGDSCTSGGNGVFLYGGENNLIYNNLVFDNTKGGIFSRMKSQFNKISYNSIMNNGQGGIILRCKLSRFSTIDNNNIEDNKGPGIYIGGSMNTIEYNVINSNIDGSAYNNDASVPNGIRVSREADFTNLISNIVTDNSAEDIWVKDGLTDISGYNNTYNSSKNYDEAWGMKMVKVSSPNTPAGLPSMAPTPLMAIVLVFLGVIIVVGGYMWNNTPNHESKKFSYFSTMFKRRNKK